MSDRNELGTALEAEGWNGWNDALDAIADRLRGASAELSQLITGALSEAEATRLRGKLQGVSLALDYARGMKRTAETLYRYTVPATYKCAHHTVGDVLTVRLKGEAEGNPGWFYVENVDDLDEFPVRLSELTAVER
ncbi:hypothetical protein [Mycobacterium phage WXIN]|nr:hypothetical protein [Mycobacterium phage WXIN]